MSICQLLTPYLKKEQHRVPGKNTGRHRFMLEAISNLDSYSEKMMSHEQNICRCTVCSWNLKNE